MPHSPCVLGSRRGIGARVRRADASAPTAAHLVRTLTRWYGCKGDAWDWNRLLLGWHARPPAPPLAACPKHSPRRAAHAPVVPRRYGCKGEAWDWNRLPLDWSYAGYSAGERGIPWKQQSVNVKSVGAKGDGSSDDTAAIERAIGQAGSGTAVYFPPGGCVQDIKRPGLSARAGPWFAPAARREHGGGAPGTNDKRAAGNTRVHKPPRPRRPRGNPRQAST